MVSYGFLIALAQDSIEIKDTVYIRVMFRWEVPFIVARMAVVDYDYDAGVDLTKAENITWWWDVYTIFWIFISSIVILNLFIALMSDR